MTQIVALTGLGVKSNDFDDENKGHVFGDSKSDNNTYTITDVY